jgi:hypothetical protein
MNSLENNIKNSASTVIQRWHGVSTGEIFSSINNLVETIVSHQPAWNIPAELLAQLIEDRDKLQTLIEKCRSVSGSMADRTYRDSLLRSTVSLCRNEVKIWAYSAFSAGVLTATDVHQLGFLLPSEHGGKRVRTKATDALAEVKIYVINADVVRVTIDNAAGANAARVKHGWPHGVKYAMIVIIAGDGKTEVYRELTTHLHNDIRMPDGSHGKQFIVKAAFLKHINDEPKFGADQTFSMPATTEDLAATFEQQHREMFEKQAKIIEQLQREIERLTKELNVKNKI